MHAFIDFEASSLGKQGYPIEVAWVFENGASETHLIRPAPHWTDWDSKAERIHGISRALLVANGCSHGHVAHRLLTTLTGHQVYASAPSWDGKWLSTLFRAAGIPRHAIRLRDTEEAQFEAAAEVLRSFVTEEELDERVAAVLERVRAEAASWTVRHRALDDAVREHRLWLHTRRLAEDESTRSAARAAEQRHGSTGW